MTRFLSSALMAAAVATSLFAGAAARADFPEQPVKILVPATAGGTADIVARFVAQRLSDLWGKPVLVDNRPGGMAVVGTEAVARSRADGYTLGLFFSSHPVVPLVVKNLNYDVKKDFVAVGPVATAPGLLVVNSELLNVRTAKEAFDLAKANPNKYNYGSAVPLSNGHRTMELLKRASGAQIQHVAYKGGAQAVTDLIGGQVQFLVGAAPTLMAHVKSGKIRALGVTTLKRFDGFPEAPPLAETGFPGFESVEWYGLFMPAGVPPAIVQKVATDLRRVLSAPDVRDRFTALGAIAWPGSSDDLDRMVNKEYALWSRLSTEVKLQAD